MYAPLPLPACGPSGSYLAASLQTIPSCFGKPYYLEAYMPPGNKSIYSLPYFCQKEKGLSKIFLPFPQKK